MMRAEEDVVMDDIREFPDRLRKWQVAVAEHLGLNASELLDLDDAHALGDDIAWRAIADQSAPRVGHASSVGMTCGGDGPEVVYDGVVHLSPMEWDDLIAVVGPKPCLMTREQELLLKGLAYEASREPS